MREAEGIAKSMLVLTQERGTLLERVEELKAENNSLHINVELQRRYGNKKDKQIAELEKDENELRSRFREQAREIAESRQRIAELDGECNKWMLETKNARRRIEELEQQTNPPLLWSARERELEKRIAELEKEHDRLVKDKITDNEVFKIAEQRIVELEKDYRIQNDAIVRGHDRIAELESRPDCPHEEYQNRIAELEKALQDSVTLNDHLHEQSVTGKFKAQAIADSKRVAELESKLNQCQEGGRQLERQKEKLAQDLDYAKTRLSQALADLRIET